MMHLLVVHVLLSLSILLDLPDGTHAKFVATPDTRKLSAATQGDPPSSNSDRPFYTCKEIVPDLCALNVKRGQLSIKGINVTYWKYTQTTKQEDDMPMTSHPKLPVVVLHGGPSFTHNYMLPLQKQACYGRTVYFYDQAGCGQSTPNPNSSQSQHKTLHKYPWLLDPDYYATVELPALLKHWNLHDSGFHIVGNSWGTMLAQLYVLNSTKADQQGLASMVLSGPLSDSQTYIQAQWDPVEGNLGSLPDFIQKRIQTLERQKAYQSPEYQAINSVLTGFFTVRTQPPPDCWIAAEQQANQEIYVAMQGPSEFTMSGVLAPYNLTARLPDISVPILLTHGTFDTMRPSVVATMEQQLPNAQSVLLHRSGHVSMIDEPQKMNTAMANFYQRVEDELQLGAFHATSMNSREAMSTSKMRLQQAPATRTRNNPTNTQSWWPQLVFPPVTASTCTTSHQASNGMNPNPPSLLLLSATFMLALTIGFLLGDWRARHVYRMQYTAIIHAAT